MKSYLYTIQISLAHSPHLSLPVLYQVQVLILTCLLNDSSLMFFNTSNPTKLPQQCPYYVLNYWASKIRILKPQSPTLDCDCIRRQGL